VDEASARCALEALPPRALSCEDCESPTEKEIWVPFVVLAETAALLGPEVADDAFEEMEISCGLESVAPDTGVALAEAGAFAGVLSLGTRRITVTPIGGSTWTSGRAGLYVLFHGEASSRSSSNRDGSESPLP
jgi:hypothetical protein